HDLLCEKTYYEHRLLGLFCPSRSGERPFKAAGSIRSFCTAKTLSRPRGVSSGVVPKARAVGSRGRPGDALERGTERLEREVAALFGYVAQLAVGRLKELARSIHTLRCSQSTGDCPTLSWNLRRKVRSLMPARSASCPIFKGSSSRFLAQSST